MNSWRALARMARDRIVASHPEDLTTILGVSPFRRKVFSDTYSVAAALVPSPS